MELFELTHITLLAAILGATVWISAACRSRPRLRRPARLAIGIGLIVNELVWWMFRYSQEGFRFPESLPLHLSDIAIWATAVACLTLRQRAVEFSYFAGIAGGAMAVLQPDLWQAWPSYSAIYFFLAHGGVIVGAAVLVLGRIATLRSGSVWRAFGFVAAYAAFVGAFNAVFGTNYMYLCRKPEGASLLDLLGPWPVYLAGGAVIGLALFWLLWIPARVADAVDAAS